MMELVRAGAAGSGAEPGDGRTFSGTVRLQPLFDFAEVPNARIAHVSFESGGRTFWHCHEGGQLLYVVDGEGRVGNDEEVVPVHPGDIVRAAPGERHWHGAATGGSMVHMAVSLGATEWLEEVDEGEAGAV